MKERQMNEEHTKTNTSATSKGKESECDDLSSSIIENVTASNGTTLIDVTSPIGTSGEFIKLAEEGKLQEISPLVAKHHKVGTRLAIIEGKLRHCNIPESLNELATYCKNRQKDFVPALKQLVKKLEDEKARLRSKLRTIERQLSQKQSSLAKSLEQQIYTVPADQLTLVPARHVESDPDITRRNALIFAKRKASAAAICRMLDLEFVRPDEKSRVIPEPWVEKLGVRTFVEAHRHEKCRPLVETLISKAKKHKPYLPS
jgi:hypothetical protein